MDRSTVWSLLVKNMEETLNKYNFSLFYPDGKKTPELPIAFEGDDGEILLFSGTKGAIKILYENHKFSLFFSGSPLDETGFAEFAREEQALLEYHDAAERDVKWLASEFSESITNTFGNKSVDSGKKNKLPQTVSKSAVKSGVASYDPATLASRFTVIYPELREEYRQNVEKYGDFLSEEFFQNYGTPVVLETIKGNYPQNMKKLFNMFNDIYEDGTNETQSLIAVTILGAMHNDPKLIENASAYMSETLKTPVLEVCKYLSSYSSSKDRTQLKNPPAYKPKKKKGGLMSKLMGGM